MYFVVSMTRLKVSSASVAVALMAKARSISGTEGTPIRKQIYGTFYFVNLIILHWLNAVKCNLTELTTKSAVIITSAPHS